jgi:hypothetical protein
MRKKKEDRLVAEIRLYMQELGQVRFTTNCVVCLLNGGLVLSASVKSPQGYLVDAHKQFLHKVNMTLDCIFFSVLHLTQVPSPVYGPVHIL